MVTVCPIVIVDGLRKGGIMSYSGVSLMVTVSLVLVPYSTALSKDTVAMGLDVVFSIGLFNDYFIE